MELIKDLLDDDEKILWMKEIYEIDFLHKKQKRRYKYVKPYYPDNDEILRNYSVMVFITNKHLITFSPNRSKYPYWFKVDISHIYEHRREFGFFNWDKLTEIIKDVKIKKDINDIGLYFDLTEYKLVGDDAPHCWINELTKEEFEELLGILIKVAPNAKIVEGLH